MPLLSHTTLAYFSGTSAEFADRPFYRLRMEGEQVQRLIEQLQACAERADRGYTLIATREEPHRLRLVERDPPEDERRAAPIHLRGELFRVSGRDRSCAIDFSGGHGAALLAERLGRARGEMRRFLEWRVPRRRRNLLEFVPDVELEAAPTPEHRKLAASGAALAGRFGPPDEFADWESPDA